VTRFGSVALAVGLCLLWPSTGRADPDWPFRLNVTMPLGHTWGSERLHGFTWGFRGSGHVYPTGRGAGFGGYAETLLDTETHSLWSFGASASHPVHSFELDDTWGMDWRAGGYGGVRYSGEGNDDDPRLAVGAFTELNVPAYLYEFRTGLRVDGTFHGGLSAMTIALDLDLIGLLGLMAWAAGSK
jgi:hypothetical protein